mmetsp:Transcript_6172/g.6444  ORF Transcript_6172/g.6444 Transcript_6172/m.6444 type:complete len:220 (-) Transcript_6172:190-849(-)
MLTNKQKWRRIQSNIKTNEIEKIIPEKNITEKVTGVSFNQKARLVLVPSRQDYKVCGLHNELWWQPTDYLHFKSEAKEEVTILMKLNNMDVKSAINHLYQPHHHNHHNHNRHNHIQHLLNHQSSLHPIHTADYFDHVVDAQTSPSAITRSPPSPEMNIKSSNNNNNNNNSNNNHNSFHHPHIHNLHLRESNNINFLIIHPKNVEQTSSKFVHPLALMVS